MHLSLTSSCCLQKVFEKNSAVKTHENRVATRYPRGLPVVIPANKGKYPKPYINIETRAINTEIERPQIFQLLDMRYFLWILYKWKFCFIAKHKQFFLFKRVAIDKFLKHEWNMDKCYWSNVCKLKPFKYVGPM